MVRFHCTHVIGSPHRLPSAPQNLMRIYLHFLKLSRYGYEPVESYSLTVDETGEPVSADVLTGSKIVEK